MSSANRPSYRQSELLVEYLERTPALARGLLKTAQGRAETKRKWASLASTLNAMGGSIKDGPGWCKYWTEKKCYLKRICSKNSASMRRTGGGPSDPSPKFSDLEQRMVAVMGGEEFATGDQHLAINPFPTQETTRQEVQVEANCEEEVAVDEALCNQPPSLEMVSCEDIVIDIEEHPEPITPRADQLSSNIFAHPQASQRRAAASRRSHVDVEVDRMTAIEEKRVEAELLTAQGYREIAAAIRDGAVTIANALREIAMQLFTYLKEK